MKEQNLTKKEKSSLVKDELFEIKILLRSLKASKRLLSMIKSATKHRKHLPTHSKIEVKYKETGANKY